jgi:hypothetical protein
MPATHERTELQAFHDFVGERLRDTHPPPTPEEVVAEWELLNADSRRARNIRLIQEALDDLEAGDVGVPFEEHLREMRQLLQQLNGQ